MTAVPKRLLKALDTRDGHRCAWHWEGACDTATLVPQHRQNRGMGGSKAGMRIANLVWLCAEFNGLIEADARMARAAIGRGIKVPRNGRYTAADIPILHAAHNSWGSLDGAGGFMPMLEATAYELLDVYGLLNREVI